MGKLSFSGSKQNCTVNFDRALCVLCKKNLSPSDKKWAWKPCQWEHEFCVPLACKPPTFRQARWISSSIFLIYVPYINKCLHFYWYVKERDMDLISSCLPSVRKPYLPSQNWNTWIRGEFCLATWVLYDYGVAISPEYIPFSWWSEEWLFNAGFTGRGNSPPCP